MENFVRDTILMEKTFGLYNNYMSLILMNPSKIIVAINLKQNWLGF